MKTTTNNVTKTMVKAGKAVKDIADTAIAIAAAPYVMTAAFLVMGVELVAEKVKAR